MEAAAPQSSGVRVNEENPTIELNDPPSSSTKVTARSESTSTSSSVSSDSLSSVKALRALASGAGAGIVTTLVCSPFDVAKVRIQVQGSISSPHSNYATNTLGVLKAIMREEGIRGFYAGLTPALLTVPLFWSIYWGSYTRLKDFFEDKLPPTVPIFVQHVFAAIGAGAAGDIITNPLWVTRTRMQTLIFHRGEYGLKGPSRAVAMETIEHAAATVIATDHGKKTKPGQMTTLRMMQTIYKQEGITAFYRGLGASFLGLTHVAIQFPLCKYT
jgi:solute carrier family 25 (mitochondrial folate transporter), member 32